MKHYPLISALLVITMAMTVLTGWVLHVPLLVQIHPSFVAMQFNTAFCFLLSGLALLSLIGKHPRVAALASAVVVLVGSLTLLQYLLGQDLRIDELLMTHDIGVEPEHPGRPGFNTAVCFVLLGLATLIQVQLGPRRARRCVLGTIVTTLGVVSLFGYLFGVASLYGWGARLSGMALHTSLGFIAMGTAFCRFATKGAAVSARGGEPEHEAARLRPISVAIPIVVVMLCVSQALVRWQRELIMRESTNDARLLADLAERKLEDHMAGLRRMAQRWRQAKGIEHGAWDDDALQYIRDLEGLIAVAWVDATGEMRYSMIDHSAPDVLRPLRLREIADLTEQNGGEAFGLTVLPVPIRAGEQGFIAIYPVTRGEESDGHIVGVFRPRELLVDAFEIMLSRYDITVSSDHGVVFSNTLQDIVRDRFTISSPAMNQLGLGWRIEMRTKHTDRITSVGALPTAIALMGIMLACASALFLQAHHQSESQRRQNQELVKELQRQKTALDEHAIVAVTDPRGVITKVNQKFCEISQYSPQELVGRTHKLVNAGYHPRSFFTEMWKTISRGEIWRGEVCNRAKDGSLYWVNTSIVPFTSVRGKITHYVAIRNDITSSVKSERELKRLNRELERSNEEMSQFTHSVSHDLKSPLITIRGYLGHLRTDLGKGRTERAEDFIEKINAAAVSMARTIDDLLELSRVGRAAHEPQRVELGRLVQEVAMRFGDQFREAGVELVIDPGLPVVRVDRVRFAQLLQNLIANALKYGRPAQGAGRITVGCQRARGDLVIFVKDNGPGIDPAHHEKIFGIFSRIDTGVEGTGVGLALVKRIAQLHQGEVWVESSLGNGAVFCVSLPESARVSEGEPIELPVAA